MVYDTQRGVLVLFGGKSHIDDIHMTGFLDDTWEYTDGHWYVVETTIFPPARYGHGMAYDFKRNVTVMYGGVASRTELHSDTWEFDGMVWQPCTGCIESPGGREFPIMVPSPTHEGVLLAVGTARDDTWHFDGGDWKLLPVIIPSPIRYSLLAEAVYDSNKQVVVLQSGLAINGSETFVLNNGKFEFVATRGDTVDLFEFGLTYDSMRHRVVLFGGWRCRAVEEDDCLKNPQHGTWEFDGEDWYVVEPRQSPPARYGHAMAYDESRGVTVLFGGMGENGTTLNDTWEYDGVTWTQR